MDLTKQLKAIFGFSPQKDQQNKYKSKARATGLMSIDELSALLKSKDEEKLSEVLSYENLQLSIPCSVSLAINQVNSEDKTLKLKDQVIFDNSNFHGIVFDPLELAITVKKLEGQSITLNVNHSQNPEHFIGYFSNAKLNKDNQITADIEIDTQNPAFASQKYAIEKGVELGFSIEVRFDWDCEFIVKPTNAEIYGLATTMIPSAPATLTEIDTEDLQSNNTITMDEEKTTKLDTTTEEVVTNEAVDTTTDTTTDAPATTEETVDNLAVNIQIAELNTQHSVELEAFKSQLDEKDEAIAKLSKALETQIENLTKANTALQKANTTVSNLNSEILKLRKPQSINNFL